MKKIAEFVKDVKGKKVTFKALLDGKTIVLDVNGIQGTASVGKHPQHGWYYQTFSPDILKTLGVKANLASIVHESAELAKRMKEAAEQEEKQKELEQIEKDFEALSDGSEIKLVWGTSHTVVVTEGSKAYKHKYFEETSAAIHKLSSQDIQNIIGRKANEVDHGDYEISYTFILSFAEYKKVAAEAMRRKEEKEQAKKERDEQRRKEIEAKFEEAKKTGKPVEINRWTEECSDPEEECDLDIVVEYALPDGRTEIKKFHTW